MSARALQRVVVRMLYDPALVEAVYADPQRALADVDLEPDERSWLVAPDRRRWRADPLRRTRGLQALLEEYPAASARAVRAAGVPWLDRFFSAAAFHDAVQHRGSTALAFGDWMIERADAESEAQPALRAVAPLAHIERGIAQVQRAARAGSTGGTTGAWQTAAHVVGLRLPAGALAGWSALRARLMEHPSGPIGALLDADWSLPPPPATTDEQEGVLIERRQGVDVAGASLALAGLLEALRTPHDWPQTVACLGRLGADPDEAEALVEGFLADGLLTRR